MEYITFMFQLYCRLVLGVVGVILEVMVLVVLMALVKEVFLVDVEVFLVQVAEVCTTVQVVLRREL